MEVFDEISDDDDDFMEYIQYERRPYVIRQRKNPFEEFDDQAFFTRFRLRKPTVLFILEQIEELIEFPTDRNNSVSPINQLLLTLRLYATGNFLLTDGDLINISESTACNIIKRVTNALASLAPHYIKMPVNEQEILEARLAFFEIARMPRTIGSLDCTHIRIQSPGGNMAETFRNRKGYFSINVQTVSSKNLKIIDIVARWPGSVHDQTIFDNCSLRHRLESGEFGNSIIVADSGYSNTRHVVTPLSEIHNGAEELYNESVRRTRNPVERQYGLWKRRFPILATGLRLKLETSLSVTIACAILHNIAIDHKEEIPPEEPREGIVDYDENIEPANIEFGQNLQTARDVLINDYFSTLV